MSTLQGKVVLITGAAGGIGKATSELLARNSATVIATDIDDETGLDFVAGLSNENLAIDYQHLDVTNEQQWIDTIEAIENKHKKFDVLVNNAGVTMGGLLENMAFEDWRYILGVNLDGAFLGTKHAIRAMKQTGGVIINVSSITAIQAFPFTGAAGSSKSALNQLTKVAAQECARENYPIRINCVNPGAVDTLLWSEQGWSSSSDYIDHEEQARQEIMSEIPLKRFANPAEIAQGILFLASDASSYMHGSEITIDGGVTSGHSGRRLTK